MKYTRELLEQAVRESTTVAGVLRALHIRSIGGSHPHFADCRLTNLRFLCPNCHSQTGNFAGRGKPRWAPTPAAANGAGRGLLDHDRTGGRASARLFAESLLPIATQAQGRARIGARDGACARASPTHRGLRSRVSRRGSTEVGRSAGWPRMVTPARLARHGLEPVERCWAESRRPEAGRSVAPLGDQPQRPVHSDGPAGVAEW